jgi:hypothetical protein
MKLVTVIRMVEREAVKAGSIRGLARKWKLSAPYISDVLLRRRDPGPSILRKLKLRKMDQPRIEPTYAFLRDTPQEPER